ncbi:MAG: hypothetical protein JW925_06620 [Syntrophaceae bacterium]|nr:hypothetical protein [Syntrophaceae bacterium]
MLKNINILSVVLRGAFILDRFRNNSFVELWREYGRAKRRVREITLKLAPLTHRSEATTKYRLITFGFSRRRALAQQNVTADKWERKNKWVNVL